MISTCLEAKRKAFYEEILKIFRTLGGVDFILAGEFNAGYERFWYFCLSKGLSYHQKKISLCENIAGIYQGDFNYNLITGFYISPLFPLLNHGWNYPDTRWNFFYTLKIFF